MAYWKRWPIIFLLIPLMAMVGCFELGNIISLDKMFRQNASDGPIDENTVAAGLKDALRVGTERAVNQTAKIDGFLANELIRITIPEELNSMTKTLKSMGLERQVDAFEIAMNRAAESAVGEAKEVFWKVISQITIADAYTILNGGETAATEYFRDHASSMLRAQFGPIVSEKMEETGLYQIYNSIVSTYNALPLSSKPMLKLDKYITENTLDGLFSILAQEEKRIREDPAARTTALLRQVFGI